MTAYPDYASDPMCKILAIPALIFLGWAFVININRIWKLLKDE